MRWKGLDSNQRPRHYKWIILLIRLVSNEPIQSEQVVESGKKESNLYFWLNRPACYRYTITSLLVKITQSHSARFYSVVKEPRTSLFKWSDVAPKADNPPEFGSRLIRLSVTEQVGDEGVNLADNPKSSALSQSIVRYYSLVITCPDLKNWPSRKRTGRLLLFRLGIPCSQCHRTQPEAC